MFKKIKVILIIVSLLVISVFVPKSGSDSFAGEKQYYVITEDTTISNSNDTTYTLENDAVLTIEDDFTISNSHLMFTGKGKVVVNERISIVGGATLTVDKDVVLEAKKGINVRHDSSLILDGEGRINAIGSGTRDGCNAGIGGNKDDACGTIIVNDGNITATGGYYYDIGAAGIGGGSSSKCGGKIIINGGNITARGGYANGDGGAGIGGGVGNTVSSITINGGNIDAVSGKNSAGIGSGPYIYGYTTNVYINGGNVSCFGNIGGAAVHSNYYEEVTISIEGGSISAHSIGYGSEVNELGKARIYIGWKDKNDKITLNKQGGFTHTTSLIFTSPFSKDGVMITPEEAMQINFPACSLYPAEPHFETTTMQPSTIKPTVIETSTVQAMTTEQKNVEKSKVVSSKVKLRKPSIRKIKSKKKSLIISWKRIQNITGYKLQYSTKKNFKKSKTVIIKKVSVTSKSIKKLKRNKKYYVRLKTYKVVNGKKYQSPWSKRRTKKTR